MARMTVACVFPIKSFSNAAIGTMHANTCTAHNAPFNTYLLRLSNGWCLRRVPVLSRFPCYVAHPGSNVYSTTKKFWVVALTSNYCRYHTPLEPAVKRHQLFQQSLSFFIAKYRTATKFKVVPYACFRPFSFSSRTCPVPYSTNLRGRRPNHHFRPVLGEMFHTS